VSRRAPCRRVDEGRRHVGDAFLGTDERDDFFFRIELDAEALLVPSGHRLTVFHEAGAARVAMVDRLARALDQLFDDRSRRRDVRIADAEIDQIDAARQRRAFFAVYFGKQIWR
jgi:hypothetical protein